MNGRALDRARAALEETAAARVRQEWAALLGRPAAAAPPAADDALLDLAREGAAGNADPAWAALHGWQLREHLAARVALAVEREHAWRERAVVLVPDGRRVPLRAAPDAIAATAARGARQPLDDARAALLAADGAVLARERVARTRGALAELVPEGDAAARLTTLLAQPVAGAVALAERLLGATEAMWADVRPTFLRRAGAPASDATAADLAAARRAPRWDGAFPPGGALGAARGVLEALALAAPERLTFVAGAPVLPPDAARCLTPVAPHDVRVVAAAAAGAPAWARTLRAAGEGAWAAHAPADLPAEAHRLPDPALPGGVGALLAALLGEEPWLARAADLPADARRDWRAQHAFAELAALRAMGATLLHAVEALDADDDPQRLGDRWVERLDAALGVRHHRADGWAAVDPALPQAGALRGAVAGASLECALRERFDADWFRNPAAGGWLREVVRHEGARHLADDFLREAADVAPDVHALVRRLAVALD